MRIGYFVDKFDPITNEHIKYAKKLIVENQLSALYFVVEKQLSNNELNDTESNIDADCIHRIKMIQRAIHPYRKFKTIREVFDLADKEYVFTNNSLQAASNKVKNGDFSLLCYSNKKYIMNHGLYCLSIVRSQISEKRYLHSISVAELSKNIAESNGYDPDKAFLIGVYHDIAKKMDVCELERVMTIYKPYEIKEAHPVWHQYVGSYILKHKYKMSDKESIKAIRHHCLGDDFDIYSKIIFIADKLDPSRGYDSSKEIKIALKDVNKGFEVVKKQNEEYLKKTGVKI